MGHVRVGTGATQLKTALVLAPIVMLGYLAGLPYGPKGVALGYSTAMILWAIPHTAWCVHGTGISLRDILVTVARPLLAGLVGATIAFSVHHACIPLMSPLPRVIIAGVSTSSGLRGNPVLRRGTEGALHECLAGAQKTRTQGRKSLSVSLGSTVQSE